MLLFALLHEFYSVGFPRFPFSSNAENAKLPSTCVLLVGLCGLFFVSLCGRSLLVEP